MAVPLLSPAGHSAALRMDSASPDEMERLAPGMGGRSSSYRSMGYGNSGSSNLGGSPSMATLGESSLMDRQRSGSRISLRPSFETLSMANGSSSTASSNPDSVAAAAVPVAAIGKVNVTDPWGTAWGMDSPYDASVAYASNPNRITMRQSAYFGSGLTLASLAGPTPIYASSNHPINMASTSDGTLHPHMNASSPAPSSFSSISGSQTSSGNANVWSEVSSTRSFNGVTPPSAPWVNDSNNSNKRRSVSFQGDLNQFASNGNIPSPTYSSDSHHSSGVPSHLHQQMPNLRARSTTHLPSLIKQQRHSTAAMNRRTLSTPGSEADRSAFRKSFIGGSVVNQSGQSAYLPPIPVDPKVSAKQSKKSSSNLSGRSITASGGNASSRASIMANATDRTDALSTMSGSEGGKKTKRKSWFARAPSSLGVETLSSSSINNSNSASNTQSNRGNTRRSIESLSTTSHGSSSTSSRPPALSRAGSSFNTFNGSPPPPTPPIPDTLPLPPSSLNEKSRKSSNNSLKNRVNGLPGSCASTPSPSVAEIPPPPPPSSAQPVNPNLMVATAPQPPATPHGPRSNKAPNTPSVYGTPLASPSNTSISADKANGNVYGAPTSSSPLSMSPMTSPTSAFSMTLKPVAPARPFALQLPTHEEHSMQPDSFPSPTTRSESLSRDDKTGEVDYIPTQPTVTMSLPPTPITESGPGGPARNALAPAAVIKASPSSPPALGSLAAMADEERASLHFHSPTQTPTSNNSRARISPASRGRSSSRPTSPLDSHQLQQRGASLQAMETSTPRSSSRGSATARSAASMSPATSRKASSNSLRATVQHAPPSPEPSSAIVEHMPSNSQDDQFLPLGPSDILGQVSTSISPSPPTVPVEDKSAAPPHQPTLNMSLSSFAPRKAFPVTTSKRNMAIITLPRKSSAQSVLPETVPLPDSPAILQDGFGNNQPNEGQTPLQPRGLAPQPHLIGDKHGSTKQLKPRASSPNLQNQHASQAKTSSEKSAAIPQPSPASTTKSQDTPARKSSKWPFSLLKRDRSKTLGDGSISPSEAAAAQLHAPPPAMLARKTSIPYESIVATGSPPKQPTSAKMTPAPTPQLSFSSSTISTIAGSDPSDQFYADFAPDARPSFLNQSSSSGNNTSGATGRDATLKKSLPPSGNHHNHQQQNNKMPIQAGKPQNSNSAGKSAFSRMFGNSSSKRKA